MLPVQLFGFTILIMIAVMVSRDARKRGMSVRWGVGVRLLLIVFLPWYLIVRKPLLPVNPEFDEPPPVDASNGAGKDDEGRPGRIFG